MSMVVCTLDEQKTIMFLGAGKEQCEAISIALELGLKVVAVDQNSDAPGLKIAQIGIAEDINNVEEMIHIGRKYNIDGVMTHAVEIPQTVAKIARELNLPGISPEVAERATNKFNRIKCFSENDIPCPKFEKVSSVNEAKIASGKLGYPVVLKPADNSGARGVIKVSGSDEVESAFLSALKYSKLNYVLVEEFLEGRELSTESLIYDGEIYTVAFADRNYDKKRFEPYFIEDGGQLPTNSSKAELQTVIDTVNSAIKALGINWGVAKGDILIDKIGVKILEMAVRTSGGRFCSLKVPLSCGVNLLRPFILMSVGLEPDLDDLKPKFTKFVAERFIFPKPGKIIEINGLEKAKKIDGIYRIELNENIKIGNTIGEISNHAQRIGYAIAIGNSYEDAIKIAETAISNIQIITKPNT